MATVTGVDASDPKITTDPNDPLYVDLSGDTGSFDVTVTGSDGGDTVILGDFEGKVNTGDGNDLVDASGGGSTVTGGDGNDFMVSSDADDVAKVSGDGNKFIFKGDTGKDVIDGFDLKNDVIKLRGYDRFDNAKDVLKHAKQDGDNVVIKLGDGNKITLLNVDLKDLKKNPGDHFDVS
jgi:Ca2+-binding RTX toxin-like protein